MIIDFHAHLWARDDAEEAMARLAARHGIDRICVSAIRSYVPDEAEVRACNERVVRAMRRWPELYIGFVYVNPKHGRVALEMIDEAAQQGMAGIKLWTSCYADDPSVYPIAEKAIELGWPILQHAWRKWTGNLPTESEPRHIARLAERYPELKLVMAHIGGDWEYGIKAVRHCPNLYVDTSGSLAHTGMLEMSIEELGAKRVIWGTDMPGADLIYTLAKIDRAPIPTAQRKMILGDNARRLMNL
ncbi:MAG: amidohydrolase family protein [Candidatus Zipacnadales bacterium]